MSVDFGFALYTFNTFEYNAQLVEAYTLAGFKRVFMSLNLVEEHDFDAMKRLIALCRHRQLDVTLDIDAVHFEQIGFQQLAQLDVQCLRLDDGFSFEQLLQLSQKWQICLNASTIKPNFLATLQDIGVQLHDLTACHNYYPKPYTGLSYRQVQQQNAVLQSQGIECQLFIAGDEKRLPIYEGLPTVEDTRLMRPLLAALSIMFKTQSNVIWVADATLNALSLAEFKWLTQGIIPLRADVADVFKHQIWHNRIDASEHVIRISQVRGHSIQCKINKALPRTKGTIVVANNTFGRYAGELEICLVDLPSDSRQTVIGHIHADDVPLLEFVQYPLKFVLI